MSEKLRWPLARASTVRELEKKVERLTRDVAERSSAASRAYQARETAVRECADIARDLKLLRVQLEQSPHDGTVYFQFAFSSHVLVSAYRTNDTWADVLAHECRRLLNTESLGRDLLRTRA